MHRVKAEVCWHKGCSKDMQWPCGVYHSNHWYFLPCVVCRHNPNSKAQHSRAVSSWPWSLFAILGQSKAREETSFFKSSPNYILSIRHIRKWVTWAGCHGLNDAVNINGPTAGGLTGCWMDWPFLLFPTLLPASSTATMINLMWSATQDNGHNKKPREKGFLCGWSLTPAGVSSLLLLQYDTKTKQNKQKNKWPWHGMVV